jgi:transposase
MAQNTHLEEVSRWSRSEQEAHERFVDAIVKAHRAGHSLRAIAEVTDTSFVSVGRWLRKRKDAAER